MLSGHSEAVAMIAWLKKQSKAAKQGYKAIQIVKKWRRSIYFTYDCHAMTSSYEIDCKLILSLRRSVLNDAKGLKIDHMTSNRATEITAYYFFLKANDSWGLFSKQVQVLRDLNRLGGIHKRRTHIFGGFWPFSPLFTNIHNWQTPLKKDVVHFWQPTPQIHKSKNSIFAILYFLDFFFMNILQKSVQLFFSSFLSTKVHF